MQKAQTFRMLDSERWEATVMQGNIFPDVALQGEHSDIQVVILPQMPLTHHTAVRWG